MGKSDIRPGHQIKKIIYIYIYDKQKKSKYPYLMDAPKKWYSPNTDLDPSGSLNLLKVKELAPGDSLNLLKEKHWLQVIR
jgi:hypothetical protein